MSDAKIREAFGRCHAIIESNAALEPERDAGASPGTPASYKHLLWLSLNAPKLLDEGRRDKALRWLGFVQGAMWWARLASIEELKDMNRQ